MGFADTIKKIFRWIITIAIAIGVFYAGYYGIGLKLLYAVGFSLLAGGMMYITLSGYKPPESVKRILRLLFAVFGGTIIGYFSYSQGYDIKIAAGAGFIIFLILAVLLEKGRAVGGEEQ